MTTFFVLDNPIPVSLAFAGWAGCMLFGVVCTLATSLSSQPTGSICRLGSGAVVEATITVWDSLGGFGPTLALFLALASFFPGRISETSSGGTFVVIFAVGLCETGSGGVPGRHILSLSLSYLLCMYAYGVHET